MPDWPLEDDPSLESTLGPQLVVRLHGLLRAMRIYELSNHAIRDQLAEVLGLIQRVMDGEVLVVAMGSSFYVNGVRVRAHPSQMVLFENLSSELDQRRLSGFRLQDGIGADELGAFLKLVVKHEGEKAAERLAEAVTAAGIMNASAVTVDELQSLGLQQGAASEPVDRADERGRARQTFDHAVHGARRALLATARTGRPALRRVKRLVQPIVDTMMRNEYSLVGLTALKDHDEYTYVHCVNVSILSVAMGQILGFPRMALANLGVAALLHDLGKLEIPPEVLGKPTPLDDREWELIRRHPLRGLIMVSRMPGLPSTTLDMMRVCLQHHRMMDGNGYPKSPPGEAPSVLSRIVALADCFDAMTAHREYRDRPYTGYEALQILLGADQERFDPAVRWALVKAVGLYPAGSLLETRSGYLVISLGVNPDDLRRPYCRVLAHNGTIPPDSYPERWEPMPADESVVRVIPPEDYDGEVEPLLAA